jgi:hypothetical protein
LYADPTLARSATKLPEWRANAGLSADESVFTPHPEHGHYLAWFAPGQRCFLDSRLQLFTDVAADYADLSRGLGLLPGERVASAQGVLGRYGIAAVALADPDSGRFTRALLGAAGRGWAVARIDGASVLLVPTGGRLAGTAFDPEREAFGGASELPVARNGPASLAEPQPLWDVERSTGRSGSWEADAATVYLRLFDGSGPKSPALPLLAVRAARVGAEADPADFTAWFMLARAYLSLSERTWERESGAGLTPLEHVRLVQTTTALTQAALRNPDSVAARESLAAVFARRNVLDLAHRHAAEADRLARRAGRLPGEPPEAFEARLAASHARVESLTTAVQDAENWFLIRTTGLAGDPLRRARIAAGLGLAQKAIDLLRTSHPDLYGSEGLNFLADLLLQTGQAAECRVLLDRAELRGNPQALGVHALPGRAGGLRGLYPLPAYDWFDLCQCAAAGRYDSARAAADRIAGRLEAEERAAVPGWSRLCVRQFATEAALWVPPGPPLFAIPAARVRSELSDRVADAKFLTVIRADLTALAGILELERGDPAAAAARLETARTLYAAAREAAPSQPGESLAARYHEAIRKQR